MTATIELPAAPPVAGAVESYANWVHLDLKGMIPTEARLCEWLTWLHSAGFSGVVVEYEDRYPWRTFPGTFRAGYDEAAWQRIWAHCAELGLEVTPLIQTYGHLEWLLKHDRWAHLRCAGHLNLVCPQQPEVRASLGAWIDEVAQLHPESAYIHVGLDEVYHMAACPQCQAVAEASPHGELEVFLEHATFVCEAIVQSGRKPIMWADMFVTHDGVGLTHKLPKEVAVCDWNYQGSVGRHTRELGGRAGREVMAASAIRRAFGPHHLMADLSSCNENVTQWHRKISSGEVGAVTALIHTVWSRSRGLSPLYGPWEGWLPAFQTAGRPSDALSDAMRRGLEILERGQQSTLYEQVQNLAGEIREIQATEPCEQQALRWWDISLRHFAELMVLQYYSAAYEGMRSAVTYQGADPDLLNEMYEGRELLRARLHDLRADITAFLQDNEWSDQEEFLCGHIDNLFRVLGGSPAELTPVEAGCSALKP